MKAFCYVRVNSARQLERKPNMLYELNDRQVATLRAALMHYLDGCTHFPESQADHIRALATGDGHLQPLDSAGVDELLWKLNVGGNVEPAEKRMAACLAALESYSANALADTLCIDSLVAAAMTLVDTARRQTGPMKSEEGCGCGICQTERALAALLDGGRWPYAPKPGTALGDNYYVRQRTALASEAKASKEKGGPPA